MYDSPKRPHFISQRTWDHEIGRATSGLPSLVIKMDMLLFNPSPVPLPQDWPTEIKIDQYVRDTSNVSYRPFTDRQARLEHVRAQFRAARLVRLAQAPWRRQTYSYSARGVDVSRPEAWLIRGPA